MVDVLVSVDCSDASVVVRVANSEVSVVRVVWAVARSARREVSVVASVDGCGSVEVEGEAVGWGWPWAGRGGEVRVLVWSASLVSDGD